VCIRTAYFDVKSGELVLDNKQIGQHYIRGWFTIDFLSCLPVSYVTMITDSDSDSDNGGGGGGSQFKALKVLRMLRLAKMLRVFRVKNLLRRHQETIRPILNGGRIAVQIISTFLIAHVLGCMWYLVGTTTQTVDGKEVLGWTQRQLGWSNCSYPDPNSPDFIVCVDEVNVPKSSRYLASLYWAITTVSTVGYGDIVAWTDLERCFTFVATLIGVMAFATMSGTFSSIIMSKKGAVQVYHQRTISAS
jgi:hypothetical protein